MTTTLDQLARAGAETADDTPRLVWLDCFEEEHGATDFVCAVREFIAVCREPRRYEKAETWIPGTIYKTARRAVAGWREWLGAGDGWIYASGRMTLNDYAPLMRMNWPRLAPSLFRRLNVSDRWRRKGAVIDVEKRSLARAGPIFEPILFRARLTFARGFLSRVEFRDWQSADALLPAIMADQPFAEVGIRGAIETENGTQPKDYVSAFVLSERCGPAFDLIDDGRRFVGPPGEYRRFDYPDAAARARAALSAALKKRAGGCTGEAR
jgi:hypothetical protein